jgi:hypothetical protein
MDRRIRFGLIFVGPCPSTDGGFLRELCIKHIEGCSLNNRHYVLFTLERAKRSGDIIRAVEEQNRKNRTSDTELEEELLMASDGVLADGASTIVLMPVEDGNAGEKAMPSSSATVVAGGGKPRGPSSAVSASSKRSPLVAVFDKGHAFQSHEIFRVISTAKLSHCHVRAPPAVDENGIPIIDQQQSKQPTGYWSWTAAVQPDAAAVRKRAISELTSDLVGNAINPVSTKRTSLPPSPALLPVSRQPSTASVLLVPESSLESKEDSMSEIVNDMFRALEGNGEQHELAASSSSALASSSSCVPDETGDGLMPEACSLGGGGDVPSLGDLSVEGKGVVAAEDDATTGGGEEGDINDEEQVVTVGFLFRAFLYRGCNYFILITS